MTGRVSNNQLPAITKPVTTEFGVAGPIAWDFGQMQTFELTSFLPTTIVLAGVGMAFVMVRLSDLARRRANSTALVQSVILTTPIYREALATMRAASGRWSALDALERTVESTDLVERRSDEHLRYLVEFFGMIAVAIRQRAIDEGVARAMLETDFAALHAVARASIEGADDLEPLRWLEKRWMQGQR